MKKTVDRLSKELISSLQGEKIVTLVTVDHKTNLPQLSAVSWLVANQEGTKIRIAMGHKASSIANILSNGNVSLGVMGTGSYFEVKGIATVSDIIEGTMKYRVVTVEIESVEDVMFYGGRITSEPTYEKTYNQELAKKLDDEIYALLKQ